MIMNGNFDHQQLPNNHGGHSPDSLGGAADAGGKQPDHDHIKMFVGQLPRSFNEEDVRKLFEEFGAIHQINMLRDKTSGQSKGCCFITFYHRKSALDAQNALHNIRTLPGMHNPIQMKPADTENRSERKLFVGMISKKATEDDVRNMFVSFGSIEECTILRDGSGTSRGCAFVTFASRQNALNAIRVLHHSMTAEGCTSPMVVKMADTTKDKDNRRQNFVPLGNWGGSTGMNSLAQHYLNLIQPTNGLNLSSLLAAAPQSSMNGVNVGLQQLSPLTTSAAINSGLFGNFGANGLSLSSSNDFSNTASALSSLAALSNSGIFSGNGYSNSGNALQNHLSNLNALVAASESQSNSNAFSSMNSNGLHALSQLRPLHRSAHGSSSAMGSPLTSLAGYANSLSPLAAALSNGMGTGPYDHIPTTYSHLAFPKVLQPSNNTQPVNKQTEGPEGCNLFIYHLPPEYGDSDLAQLFTPFGSVISAKVFVDKITALSKCFGFVSFDNQVSASAAIQTMNGFQIGLKRLKVQLKRSKDKPY